MAASDSAFAPPKLSHKITYRRSKVSSLEGKALTRLDRIGAKCQLARKPRVTVWGNHSTTQEQTMGEGSTSKPGWIGPIATYESEDEGCSSRRKGSWEAPPDLFPPCAKRPQAIGLEVIPEEENHKRRSAQQLVANEATIVRVPLKKVFAPASSWKQGFPKNVSSCKKHETCKTPQEEDGYEKWMQNFYLFAKDNPHIFPHLHLNRDGCTQHLTSWSSVGCPAKYPVDDITEDTPCSLHVTMSRSGKTMEVALGIAKTGHIFRNMPCPADYAMVQVIKIVKDGFLNFPLDYPISDKSIETLQDAVNNFILWHRQDIILHMQAPSKDKGVEATTAQDLPPLPVHPVPPSPKKI